MGQDLIRLEKSVAWCGSRDPRRGARNRGALASKARKRRKAPHLYRRWTQPRPGEWIDLEERRLETRDDPAAFADRMGSRGSSGKRPKGAASW